MKTKFATFLICMTLCTTPARANDDILTGITALACEAILCLSSGEQPGECGPSLDHYFGINLKTFSATQAARKAFLNLCPASKEPGMPRLISAIVDGAGRCNAKLLNNVLARTEIMRVCDDDEDAFWMTDEERCRNVEVTIIDDRLPGYCRAYTTHEWGWKLGVRYEGDKNKGGKWVDE